MGGTHDRREPEVNDLVAWSSPLDGPGARLLPHQLGSDPRTISHSRATRPPMTEGEYSHLIVANAFSADSPKMQASDRVDWIGIP